MSLQASLPCLVGISAACYADAAQNGYWVAGAHLSFPGIGHIRSEGAAYTFVAANYSVPR
jgi:hypothetical protein